VAVTSHAYPKSVQKINAKLWDMTTTTAGSFLVGLCTGSASAWTSTQQNYAFVSDVTGAYTEVSGGGYARVDISAGITMPAPSSTNLVKWACTSPISFGSSVTIAAASMFVFTKLVGAADASWPVLAIVDFGGTVTSTASNWTYTLDGTNGLISWNET
jgi:hypothetical protein